MKDFIQQLPKIQDADLNNKIVLVRVDHNVVKKGIIKDPFRIDVTFGTMFNILAKGGKIILMTHVGRPKDKASGEISISEDTSVSAITDYLEHKLYVKFHVPELDDYDSYGLRVIDTSINLMIRDLKKGKIEAIYLPNTRWFRGEESDGKPAVKLAKQLAGLADVFVNDAFGSWQPHVSTVALTEFLPSYAGYLMQHEIENLQKIFNPKHPMLAIVGGSKFDTKIGPLRSLIEKVDFLILGGVIYNAYLCVKYGIEIKGISQDDISVAREFVKITDQYPEKLLELPYIVESDYLDEKVEGSYREIRLDDLKPGTRLNYVLDVGSKSYEEKKIRDVILSAKSIFVNAVMGLTPHFAEGTSHLFKLIGKNEEASKMFGGGDTLQEFRLLLPGQYIQAIENPKYYFFSGGGTILKAIEEGSVFGLEPIKALLENQKKFSPLN